MANFEAMDALFAEADRMAPEMAALVSSLDLDVKFAAGREFGTWLTEKRERQAGKAGICALSESIELRQAS